MQLIFYDHRGNGRSAPLDDFTGIDHKTWADDADALRAHLGHEKIILLGHSCGGFVALEHARRHGENLAGLILCCTAPAMDYPGVIMAKAQARSTPEQLQLVVKAFTQPLTSDEEFRGLYERIFSLYFKAYDPKTGGDIVNAVRYNYHAFNYSASTWFPAFNSLSWLSEISIPTLIIGGREDWVMPPEQGAERLHAGIPNSELVIFDNSGHMPFVEEQGRFNKVVVEWIAGLK
jgi:proline iminopeptidase